MYIRNRLFWLLLCLLYLIPISAYSKTKVINVPFVNKINVDGKTNDWKIPCAVNGFIAPWNGNDYDQTKFYACHNDQYLYLLYEVRDTTLTYNDGKTEASVGNEDRVEFFISKDDQMSTYYGAEIDPQGKVMDYESHFYRKCDYSWNYKGLILGHHIGKHSYTMEVAIPLKELRELGLISTEGKIHMGVFRADYYGSNMDQVVWRPWIVPDSKKPDFHIPSSLGILVLK